MGVEERGPPAGPGRLTRAAAYGFFLLVTVGVLVRGLDLDRMDWHAPFNYHGDALLILPLVKATVERGGHWRNERLGAPGVQELHDFPIVDHLHFAAIWLLSRVWADPVGVYNLYYLLTYPLTALTAMVAFRRLGLSLPAAGSAAVLYAFLPYHYLRANHFFLTAYYAVPLTLTVTLWVCQGRLPLTRKDADGRLRWTVRTRDTWEAVAVAAVTASAGAYYAFFGCAFLAAAGAYGWAAHRTWRAAASAALVTAVVVAAGVANHAPTFWHQYLNGRNSAPHTRDSVAADANGFKLTQLLLPVDFHRVPALARLRDAYASPDRQLEGENRTASLGAVGAVGLVGLLGVLFLPRRRAWPVGPVATLAGFGVLLGTVGGFGALFAFLVSPQVRGYNRVVVYLAFLALFAVFWLLDRGFDRGGRIWVRRLRWPVLLVVTAGGLSDQLNTSWFGPDAAGFRDRYRNWYRDDATFYGRIERAVPGGAVFCLPFVEYPEANPVVNGVLQYEPVRGYLHTDTVRWSFGAMKGREADQWQRQVSLAPPPEMLRRVTLRGFDGLTVDRRGYPPAAADELIAAVATELGPGAARFDHPTGEQVFFDLRGYRDRLRRALGGRYETEARRDADAVRVLWLNGFHAVWPHGPDEGKLRWMSPRAELVVVNPTDRPRAIQMSMRVWTELDDPVEVKIDGGPVLSGHLWVNRASPYFNPAVVVPPGRHTVRLRYAPPAGHRPSATLGAAVRVGDFTIAELPPGPP